LDDPDKKYRDFFVEQKLGGEACAALRGKS
jgi:hypothetical protein